MDYSSKYLSTEVPVVQYTCTDCCCGLLLLPAAAPRHRTNQRRLCDNVVLAPHHHRIDHRITAWIAAGGS